MGPCRQRGIHQTPARVQNREVDRGACAVQIRQENAQSEWHRLLAPHSGQGRDGDVCRTGGLFHRAGQQRVRRGLAEHSVTVVKRRLHRGRELHRLPQVVYPVAGVESRPGTRIVKRRRVIRHFRCRRFQVCELVGQIGEDRIDRRRVRRHVHSYLAGHHLTTLPLRDQVANRLGCSTDHRRIRRGDHGHHHIADTASGEFGTHLLGGQLHRGHSAGTRDAGHQLGAPANHLGPVLKRQCSGDDRSRGFAQRVPDDRAGLHAVGPQGGGQCDLEGEQRRLDPVNTGHRLRRRHRLGDRKSGLLGNQRLGLGDGCGERRLLGQQLCAHARPLRTLTRENPHRSAVVTTRRRLIGGFTAGDLAQPGGQLLEVFRDHRGAHGPLSTPARQGVGEF